MEAEKRPAGTGRRAASGWQLLDACHGRLSSDPNLIRRRTVPDSNGTADPIADAKRVSCFGRNFCYRNADSLSTAQQSAVQCIRTSCDAAELHCRLYAYSFHNLQISQLALFLSRLDVIASGRNTDAPGSRRQRRIR